ncbi:MAG TPA: RHS repeat-associated core domain-containing protein [Terriglobales bacterium]|nr:RHS repeat-associated core domain-containing protein [Terriglobales bacterium]
MKFGTTNYTYDGDNLIEETNASGTFVARYTPGINIDEPLGRSGTSLNFYNADGLGSITSLTDSAGASASTYTYGAFGNLSAYSGAVVNSYRYTAREFDQETGLYYYRARYYDPNISKFISEDPIRFESGYNLYGYVNNRPTFFTDPLGLFSKEVHYDITYGVALREFGPKCVAEAKSLASATAGQDVYSRNWVKDILVNINFFGRAWKKPGVHFPGPNEFSALDKGIASCDLNAFAQGLHSLQDSVAHAPYKPWQHYLSGSLPDWYASGGEERPIAESLTGNYVHLYKMVCLKCCSQ